MPKTGVPAPIAAADSLPSVSVVVPTRNGRGRLETCIEALRGASCLADVVVVVDGPDPETEDVLGRLRALDPRVVPIVIAHGGPAAARTVGVRHATGDVVLFFDDDIVAAPGLVEGHARHHAQRSGILVVGYTPVPAAPTRRPGTFADRLYAEEYERMCTRYERDPERILLDLWGAFSLRRSDCERIGLASPAFPLRYHEDREFGVRCHKAGLVGVFDRALLGEHRYSTAPARFIADARDQGAGRLLVHRIHEDVLGPLDVDAFSAGLPPLVGACVRLTRGRRSYGVAARLLGLAIGASGRLHLFALETLMSRVLRRVEQQHGALALAHRAAPDADAHAGGGAAADPLRPRSSSAADIPRRPTLRRPMRRRV
jgi:glycosyltransferase involved in cell wall biosynthesis